MPIFYIKKGLADIELKQWIEANKEEPFVRVEIEVESSHERLRRSFHCLVTEWFNSGEFSANGATVKTYDKLRTYYKLEGCDHIPDKYCYNNDKFDTVELLLESYPDCDLHQVQKEKSWKKMNKTQKSRALNALLTEIRMSMCNDKKVLEWVAKITGDIEMLNDINYHRNIGE